MTALSLPKKATTACRRYLTGALLASCLSSGVAVASETEEPHAAAANTSPRARVGAALLASIVLGGAAAGVGLLVDPSGTNPHASATSDRHLGGGLLLGVSGACLVGVIVAAAHHPRPKVNN